MFKEEIKWKMNYYKLKDEALEKIEACSSLKELNDNSCSLFRKKRSYSRSYEIDEKYGP